MKTKWSARGEAPREGTLLERVLKTRKLEPAFLHPGVEDLFPPERLPDMQKATDRIVEALEKKERITIYADYDCDGTVGAAVLLRYLRNLGVDVDYYIPNRLSEGYGLNRAAVEEIAARGTDLIVTVDNGISSVSEAEAIAQAGMDLIVTDHHEPQETLPQALAILDCKRADSTYPFRELCGGTTR